MTHIAQINVDPLNRSCLVDAEAFGALEWPCACTRSVNDSDGAVRGAHEAMVHIARVKVISNGCPGRVEAIDATHEGALARACAGARSIERSDGAVRIAHEAVPHIARVKVIARDFACWVDVIGVRALEGARARARSIEPREGGVGSAQVAVDHITGVTASSRDCPRRIDAESGGGYHARRVERGKGAVRTPQEAVIQVARVNVVSPDLACRVDGLGEGTLGGARARARSFERGEARTLLVSIRGKAQPQRGQD